jgi:PII-like signaling protein
LDWRNHREDYLMKIPKEGKLLRIFIGEKDKHEGKPLSEVILQMAKKEGLAGATAFKGFEGFGAKSHMHTAKLLRLSEDLPVLIEIVDSAEKIDAFIPQMDLVIKEGLVTSEKVEVVFYRAQ